MTDSARRFPLGIDITGELFTKGADLQVVMGYCYPGQDAKAAIEVYPVEGKETIQAVRAKGLSGSGIPTLLVEGDNKPGLGHAIAQSLADAGST